MAGWMNIPAINYREHLLCIVSRNSKTDRPVLESKS